MKHPINVELIMTSRKLISYVYAKKYQRAHTIPQIAHAESQLIRITLNN